MYAFLFFLLLLNVKTHSLSSSPLVMSTRTLRLIRKEQVTQLHTIYHTLISARSKRSRVFTPRRSLSQWPPPRDPARALLETTATHTPQTYHRLYMSIHYIPPLLLLNWDVCCCHVSWIEVLAPGHAGPPRFFLCRFDKFNLMETLWFPRDAFLHRYFTVLIHPIEWIVT